MSGCCFPDGRLAKRFGKLLAMISGQVGETIPAACQDWANTKAAYRFLSNDRVSETEILGGHFQATADRIALTTGPLLILHDTSEFSYERSGLSDLGLIGLASTGMDKQGRPRHHTVRGILMHSSLVVSSDGLPLGLAAIKFWNRKRFTGCNALKGKINATRVDIEKKESYRWLENLRQSTVLAGRPADCVHIGDRESDIYELFCVAQEVGTSFLVRTCVDRLSGDGSCTVSDQMETVPSKGTYRIEGRSKEGRPFEAVLDIQWQKLRVLPPIGKQRNYPALDLTVIHATELGEPEGRKRIQWKLLTNLPVESFASVVEKLRWYAMRWKIETFHKILKSGGQAQASKLRTSERLVNWLAILCIVGWRVFWMTMVRRTDGDKPAEVAFTPTEMYLLDKLVKGPRNTPDQSKTLSGALMKLAQLGGYLARASDPPPGNLVIWRGLSRLTDIQIGFAIGAKAVDG